MTTMTRSRLPLRRPRLPRPTSSFYTNQERSACPGAGRFFLHTRVDPCRIPIGHGRAGSASGVFRGHDLCSSLGIVMFARISHCQAAIWSARQYGDGSGRFAVHWNSDCGCFRRSDRSYFGATCAWHRIREDQAICKEASEQAYDELDRAVEQASKRQDSSFE